MPAKHIKMIPRSVIVAPVNRCALIWLIRVSVLQGRPGSDHDLCMLSDTDAVFGIIEPQEIFFERITDFFNQLPGKHTYAKTGPVAEKLRLFILFIRNNPFAVLPVG